jgi:hypothetical protein
MDDATREGALAVMARALDEDHERNGFTLGMVEKAEHYRMAVLMLDALGVEQAWDHDPICESCDGDGYVVDFEDAGGGTLDCMECGPVFRLRGIEEGRDDG